jgi:predicted MPP superfamily phosphohydrolase
MSGKRGLINTLVSLVFRHQFHFNRLQGDCQIPALKAGSGDPAGALKKSGENLVALTKYHSGMRMKMTSTLHNVLLLLLAGVGLAILWRVKSSLAAALIVPFGFSLLAVGAVSAFSFPDDNFGKIQLLAWTVFLHLPLFVAGVVLIFSRRRRWIAMTGGVLLALILMICVDAFLIEPRWLDISRVTLTTSKIDTPLRIVVIADIQTDAPGAYEKRVFERVMAAQPDLILFAGDYIHLGRRSRNYDEESKVLNAIMRDINLAAPLGVYAVKGNVDWSGDWPQIFEGLPVTAIVETQSFDLGPVVLTGLEMWDSFGVNVTVASHDKFHIVLGHSPNFSLGAVDADLLVAGHTHGGQVQLPFVGPIMTLTVAPRAWASGVTAIEPGKTLVVSRGIGLERGNAPRLRFLCRPELVVIDMLPEN